MELPVKRVCSLFVSWASKQFFHRRNQCINSVFPKWNGKSVNSGNSENLINHRSMNWDKFKDSVPHKCLAGAVVVSWSLIQEVAGLEPFTVMTNILVTEFSEFNENIWENTNVLSFISIISGILIYECNSQT